MKSIRKLLLPLLVFLIPTKKTYANVQVSSVNEEDMINIEDKEKRKTPILYKFFSEDNKIIQFIKHTSHRSHSSHRSHRSHYSSSYITDNSTLKKESDYNKDYDNPENANKVYAYAYRDLNVREKPDASSALITTIKKDTKVRILSRISTPWFKIEVNGYTGYVNSKYLYY